jgi:hypothetical protein
MPSLSLLRRFSLVLGLIGLSVVWRLCSEAQSTSELKPTPDATATHSPVDRRADRRYGAIVEDPWAPVDPRTPQLPDDDSFERERAALLPQFHAWLDELEPSLIECYARLIPDATDTLVLTIEVRRGQSSDPGQVSTLTGIPATLEPCMRVAVDRAPFPDIDRSSWEWRIRIPAPVGLETRPTQR